MKENVLTFLILKYPYLILSSQVLMGLCNVSVNSNWVHPPGQPPGISSKNLPGGRDLTFESCPGAGNSTRTGILWKMKVKLNKIAWIKFLQVIKQAELLTFFEVYVFSQ